MKKQKVVTLIIGILVSVLTAFLLVSCSEEEFNPSLIRNFTIPASNGASYTIEVALPEDYHSSSEKYSTVYVLDGEENFDFVATQCKEIADRNSAQNVLVVSIGYGNDRSIDYTPTKVGSNTGGGAQFMNFIENELIPRIEQDFRAETTRSGRVILGHSYGGLFGACVLAVNNNLFGNYLLLSPSIWFDNEVALLLEKQKRDINQDKPQLVFLGIGQAENSGRMQAPFEAFYQTLRDNYTNIKVSKNREKNLDHVGSKNPNIIKALNYYFQNR